MNILSDNEFYTQGILHVLETIKNLTPLTPQTSTITLYITAKTEISGISTLLLQKPVTQHAVFICSPKTKEFIKRRYPDVVKYFIAQDASISMVAKVLRRAITQNFYCNKPKFVPDNIRLSEKERIVLSLILQGYNIKSIACLCQVDAKTIYTHKNKVMKKYGARSFQEFYFFILKTIKYHQENKIPHIIIGA